MRLLHLFPDCLLDAVVVLIYQYTGDINFACELVDVVQVDVRSLQVVEVLLEVGLVI